MDITYSIMVPILQWFAKATHSYGWAIICTTLAIRLLVWPFVANSTKQMQRMSALQPRLKELQEKYKDDPQEFQKQSMEFYKRNKLNPVGGCLPMLIQLPILIALYSTFMGPPFTDKPIPVKVTLASQADKDKIKVVNNPTSGGNSAYLSTDGKLAKFVVKPGDQTLVWGQSEKGTDALEPNIIDFHTTATDGEAPKDFEPIWKKESDSNGATIEPISGQANFPVAGDIVVQAKLPGEATPIQVPIKVEGVAPPNTGFNFGSMFGGGGSSADAYKTKTERTAITSVVEINGKHVTVAVSPGDSTINAGSKGVQFALVAVEGSLEGIKPIWQIVKDPNAATIDAKGHAIFPKPGEVTMAAVIPGIAKDEPFYFISSLGKTVHGAEMFKPENWDVLGMLIAFAVTMWLSQKLMVQPTNVDPEQAAIQKQTQQTMPLMMTAMFFFFALPAGVYLYLVVSNVMQTLQTWIIYKSPAPTFDDGPETAPSAPSANPKSNGGIIDIEAKTTSTEEPDAGTKIILDGKKKKKQK